MRTVVASEIAPGSGVDPKEFWNSLEKLINNFASRNQALLRKRDALQAQIDAYHLDRVGTKIDRADYAAFLAKIGYIVPEGPVSLFITQYVWTFIVVFFQPCEFCYFADFKMYHRLRCCCCYVLSIAHFLFIFYSLASPFCKIINAGLQGRHEQCRPRNLFCLWTTTRCSRGQRAICSQCCQRQVGLPLGRFLRH